MNFKNFEIKKNELFAISTDGKNTTQEATLITSTHQNNMSIFCYLYFYMHLQPTLWRSRHMHADGCKIQVAKASSHPLLLLSLTKVGAEGESNTDIEFVQRQLTGLYQVSPTTGDTNGGDVYNRFSSLLV